MRIIILLCALLVSAPLRAAIVYVDADAPGPVHDGGSWTTAFTRVSDAAPAVRGGGEVWVAAGTYGYWGFASGSTVAVYGGFTGTENRREQRDPAKNLTVISGGNGDWAVTMGAPGIVEGFVIQPGQQGGMHIPQHINGAVTLAGNIITGGLVGILSESDSVLDGNRVSSCSRTGVLVQDKTGSVVRRNVITGCGVGVAAEAAWPLSWVQDNVVSSCQAGMILGGGILASNNTVAANGAGILPSRRTPYFSQDTGVFLANNIVAFNVGTGIGGPRASMRGMALSRNNVYGNGADYSDIPPDPADLSVDPLFADPAAGNFHIHPASPMRDRGDASIPSPDERDMDGQPRVQGAGVDIGADESDGTVWPVPPERIVRVRPGGNDTADGRTWETAKASIQAAVNAAPAGEVWIAAGEYRQPLQLAWGASLYGGFRGSETERDARDPAANVTTLNVSGADAITAGATAIGSTVDGLKIVASHTAIRAFFAALTVSRTGLEAHAGVSAMFSNLRITDSRIRSGSGSSVFMHGGTLTMARNDVAMTNPITGYCAVLENGVFTLSNNVFDGGPGALTTGGLALRGAADLRNNTITGYIGTAVRVEAPGVTLENNIVAFNSAGIVVAPGLTVASFRNDVVGNYSGDYAPATARGATDISVDPLFANPRAGDFHIQADSPARNAGDNAFVPAGDTDMDGQPRIQDGIVDIGADESDGTAYYPARPVVYVRPNGSDNASGESWAAAVKTIQEAVIRARDAEVWVARGTYPERLILLRHANVYGGFAGGETERGQRNAATNVTVIDGSGLAGDTVTANALAYGATLDGFTIRAGSGAAIQTAADVTISGNRLLGGLQGVSVTGGAPDIRRNVFTGSGTGLYVVAGGARFHDNIITGTGHAGVQANAAIKAWNNTIAGNQGDGVVLQSNFSEASNNIIAYNGGVGLTEWGASIAQNNLFFANGGSNYMSTLPNRTEPSTDPMFVDPDGGDYHLLPGSPAIDAGFDDVTLLGERDLDGKPRIIGARVDVGAYEFGEPTPPGLADAANALRIAAGLRRPSPSEFTRLNIDPSDPGITLADALAILRLAGTPTTGAP